MGKLFFSGLMVFSCLMLANGLWAQEEDDFYRVITVEGKPMLNDSLVITRNMKVRPTDFLTLGKRDKVYLRRKEFLYKIKGSKITPHGSIEKHIEESDKIEEGTFDKIIDYLDYVWKEMFKEPKKKDNIGVIFRADPYAGPIAPNDGASIYMKEITFEWNASDTKELKYFYLWQKGEEEHFSIATNGNRLLISTKGPLVEPDKKYFWGVSSKPNSDVESLPAWSFMLLGKDSFETKMAKYKGAWDEFLTFGLTEEQVRQIFCEDVNFCFDLQ